MPERFEIEKCVLAEIAELEVKIAAGILAQPRQVMETKQIPAAAGEAFMAAQIAKSFLAVLDEIGKEEHQFRSGKVTIV